MKASVLVFQCLSNALNDPAAHATGAFVALLEDEASDS